MEDSEQKKLMLAVAHTASDELDGELALSAKLDATGLDVAAKSRAVLALDRLLGGLIGWGAAYFEDKRTRAETKGKIANQRLIHDYIEERAIHRLNADAIRKQQNLEAVWQETQNLLLTAPADEPVLSKGSNTTAEPIDSNKDDSGFEDWLNIFGSYAERANSETMRQIWGKVLSGEVRKRGSFSPSALRVVSELDSSIAQRFQEIMECCVNGRSFGMESELVLKPRELGGGVLEGWIQLEEAGLIQDVNAFLNASFILSQENPESTVVNGRFILIIRMKSQPLTVVVPVVKISRVGAQLGTFIRRDERKALRLFAEAIKEDVEILIATIQSETERGISYTDIETIK